MQLKRKQLLEAKAKAEEEERKAEEEKKAAEIAMLQKKAEEEAAAVKMAEVARCRGREEERSGGARSC